MAARRRGRPGRRFFFPWASTTVGSPALMWNCTV